MSIVGGIARWVKSLGEAVYPACCEVCGRSLVDGEEHLCLKCMHSMPRTYIHRDDFNIIHQRLASPGLPIERAASYFYYFRENPYARMLQNAKYSNRPGLARWLGRMFASELVRERFFDGIDMLVPVPLHWRKRMKRGYNQAEEICRGINDVTGLPVSCCLKARAHSTQTRKSSFQRHQNVVGIYSVIDRNEIAGKHLLVVDDIITTGATLFSVVTELRGASVGMPQTPCVSILTIGCTKMR